MEENIKLKSTNKTLKFVISLLFLLSVGEGIIIFNQSEQINNYETILSSSEDFSTTFIIRSLNDFRKIKDSLINMEEEEEYRIEEVSKIIRELEEFLSISTNFNNLSLEDKENYLTNFFKYSLKQKVKIPWGFPEMEQENAELRKEIRFCPRRD